MNRAFITVMMLYVRAISISLVVCLAASTTSYFTYPLIDNNDREYRAISLSQKSDPSITYGIESRSREIDGRLFAEEGAYPTGLNHILKEKVSTDQPVAQPSSIPSGQPSNQPSSQPSRQPSGQPTNQPSTQPSGQPTGPTGQPTSQPTGPTGQPTGQPTGPTGQPTGQPSTEPSSQPIAHPSSPPSSQPSMQPTSQPSGQPSMQPTSQPSRQPSGQPSMKPSSEPSSQPTAQPTSQPSGQPSMQPTSQPSEQPSMQPTSQPSGQPSMQPTSQPSGQPSMKPTSQPSGQPSMQPSSQPSAQPSMQPTSQPSGQPSMQPTSQPSGQPSMQPTSQPSGQPSMQPTSQPSGQPSMKPTSQPSGQPSLKPTSQPSGQPSMQPTSQPSGQPSMQPSMQPTSQPSGQPSMKPTSQPSGQPSMKPTSQPSGQPSMQPSMQPTSQPSAQPSMQPTSQPSAQPSMQPTSQPSGQPSMQPTSQPSGQPSMQPTSEPSSEPSGQPSMQPTFGTPSPTRIGETNKPSYRPTVFSLPSSMPTSRPTSIISPSIPKISNVVVVPSSQNVTLTIILTAKRDSTGALFCIAMRRGRSPSSIDAVKNGGTMRQYITSTEPVTVVISGLLALVSYTAYCHVELSDGSGSTYTDMISMSREFSTSCCRRILLTNSPASVYGDVSQYSIAGNSDISSYVFSYHLESPPSRGSVVITPTISLIDGSTKNATLVSVPSSSEFFSTFSPSKLRGIFYLSTSPEVSGTFLISLVVSGQDSKNFTASTTTVDIMTISQPLQAPSLKSCQFDSSGGYLVIAFDKSTDQAGIIANEWSCSQLFIFADANTASCSWTSLSTIKVTFTALTASSLKPNDTLSVKGGMLRSACRSGTNCNNNHLLRSQQIHTDIVHKDSVPYIPLSSALSVIVQRPALPVAPIIVVIVPTQIGACNDLMIDLSSSTGSGGRPWSSVVWTVLAKNGDTTALTTFLNNNFDSSLIYVIVPRNLLIRTTYSVGVTLTNFLGDSSSSTSIVSVSSDPNLPVAHILGSLSKVIKASDILDLQGSAVLSKCGVVSSVKYSWALTNSSGSNIVLKSTSVDPRKYVAPAYSFNAGSSYKATLTVTSLHSNGLLLSFGYAVANIYVKHGNIIAVVKGGYSRECAVDKVLVLDASTSSDEDTSRGSLDLLYSWSCTIISLTNFGSPCLFSSISITTLSTSILSLPANEMVLSTQYSFSVIVSSVDGRSASQSVTVTPLPSGSPVVYSTNKLFKFNYDSVLSINGIVTANVSTSAKWTAYCNGQSVSLDRAFTKLTMDFTAKEASVTASYPLAVLANTFVAGRTYTFRLSAHPLDNVVLSAKTDVVLMVNAPPLGGRTIVFPLSGHALITEFTMSASGWSDDLSDYPLSYRFSYQLAISDLIPLLALTTLNPLPYAVSLLPAGLYGGLGRPGDVDVIGFAQDIYNAAAQASFVVNVLLKDGFDMSTFLNSSLKTNYATGNVDGVLQTTNMVSSIVDAKNCTAAPNCTVLNRYGCLEMANTCGFCMHNYDGIIGNSNTRCIRKSLPVGAVGSICKYDDDCLFHHCDNSVCVAPQQTCQTSVPNTICSGYGTCKSTDASGNIVQNCTILSTLCTATCFCQTGYGGVDCSLDILAQVQKANLRVTMCSALTYVISISEKSPQLFDTIASTLLSAYDKDEITAAAQLVKCSSVVRFLGTLAQRGFLKGTLPATQQIYAEISSQFVGTRLLSKSRDASKFANDVSNAVTGMVNGISKGMVKGQNAVSVVTSNIRATMINELVSSLSNATFSPPATVSELSYGSSQAKIIITGDGASQCSSDGSYAQLSTLQFGSNPHYGSRAIDSPLLQFSSTITTKSLKSIRPKSRKLIESKSTDQNSSNIPAYYVILQYSSEQNLNLSVQTGPYSRKSNVTIPECTLYDSVSQKYVSCGNCKLSSYTNFNATFGCYDIKNLCPSPLKKSRRLGFDQYEYDGQGDITSDEDHAVDIEDEYELHEEDENDDALSSSIRSRELELYTESVSGVADDYIPSADDGPSGSDDRFDSQNTIPVKEFGILLDAIAAQLSSVLSQNPFAIDLNRATPVLVLVGCLFGSIILGLLYFLRWDKMDRHKAVYLLDEKEKVLQTRIAEDLKKGNNGVIPVKASRKKSFGKDSFMSGFNSSMISMVSNSENGSGDQKNAMDKSFRSSSSYSDYVESKDNCPLDGRLQTNILIAQFSNDVLPKSYTLNEGAIKMRRGKYQLSSSIWTDALYTIRRKHYATAMLYRPSMYVSRTIRYIDMWRKVLLYLFIDTVLYGVFFPSDATCGTFTRKAECIATPSKVISGANLCIWNASTGCSINPPPRSITFVLLVSFIIVIFVIVLDYLVGYIQSEYAAKRPRLESWGLNTDSWLGSVHHSRDREKSSVLDAVLSQGLPMTHGDRGSSDLPSHLKNENLEISTNEKNFISNEVFNDFLSPREECIRLMMRVEEFLDGDASVLNNRIQKISQDAGGLSAEHLAAMKALSSQLMVNYDGTMKPITFRQRLFNKDRQDLIEKRLAAARRKALKICHSIEEMEVHDNNLKDIALMRKFILEQVSVFYRFSLNKNFMDIDGVPPEIIRPSVWLAAWVLIVLVLCFILYWILAWGVQNGGTTLDLWGTNYAISIAQDILVLELGKVCIIYVFAIMSAKPQLQVIKRVINDRALSLAQDGATFNDEVSVVQHFSPACRAARSSNLSNLPASVILRSITDADVERCKEHKNFTISRIIFYTIIIAALVATMSEILIDQLLTFVLSSLLLGFLLVHSKLLAISPLLLICTYGVFGGITLYHLCVFIPSVKRARQARVKKARASREFARSRPINAVDRQSNSYNYGFLRAIRNLGTRFLEYAGYLHTIISSERGETQREILRNEAVMWNAMNKTAAAQGSVFSQRDVVVRPGVSSDVPYPVRRYSGGNSQEYVIPPEILRMRQSGSSFNRQDNLNIELHRYTAQIFGSQSDGTLRDRGMTIPAVQSPRETGKLAISYMANREITTDPQTALRRMLQRHLLGAESYRNGEECSLLDLDDASNTFISLTELTEMLSWTWDTFYPGGQELSSELKSEINVTFKKWRESTDRTVSYSAKLWEGMEGIRGSQFSEFSHWFLKACDDIALHTVPSKQCSHGHRSSYIFESNRMEWVLESESGCSDTNTDTY